MAEPIKIDGLREFVRNLGKLDGELPKQVRVALNEAADVIVRAAQPRVPVRSGAARRSVRKASTRTKVRVRGGGKRAPHYAWLDFGGRVGRNKSVSRPFIKHGRYIYDAYFDNGNEIRRVMVENLLKVAQRSGVEIG